MDETMQTGRFHEHLGDGAYVRFTDFGEVELFTHNGIETLNRVVLDGVALTNLRRWIADLIALQARAG
jgi:hypothetical protein